MHSLSRLWTNAPQLLNGEFTDKIKRTVGMYREDSIWFAHIRGYLSQQFVVAYSCRGS